MIVHTHTQPSAANLKMHDRAQWFSNRNRARSRIQSHNLIYTFSDAHWSARARLVENYLFKHMGVYICSGDAYCVVYSTIYIYGVG